jgi:hypothetical protein
MNIAIKNTLYLKYLDKIEVLHLEDVDTYISENLIKRLNEKFKI